MRRTQLLLILVVPLLAGCNLGGGSGSSSEPRVLIVNQGGNYIISFNGVPHEIKGVCGAQQNRTAGGMAEFTFPYATDLNKSGANSMRFYGEPWSIPSNSVADQYGDLSAMLQFAANAPKQPFTVMVGVNIGAHDPNAGGITVDSKINYNDPNQVAAQLTLMKQWVDAVMSGSAPRSQMWSWCIGNEIVQNVGGDPGVVAKIWKAVNDIANYIKNVKKSGLPIGTAIPQPSPTALTQIATDAPLLDFVAINDYYGTYGGTSGGGQLNMLASIMNGGSWTKSWVISEWGIYQPDAGDMPGVTFNIPFVGQQRVGFQKNSTLQGQDYLTNYQSYVQPSFSGPCLGAYVYNFQPPTYSNVPSEWFFQYAYPQVAFGNGGQAGRMETVHSLAGAWGGNIGNKPPQISLGTDNDPQGITCSKKCWQNNVVISVTGQTQVTCSVAATDPEGDTLTYNWFVMNDALNRNVSGQAFLNQGPSFTFTAPNADQSTRVIVVILDGHGNAATASIVFFSVKT